MLIIKDYIRNYYKSSIFIYLLIISDVILRSLSLVFHLLRARRDRSRNRR